MKTFQILKSLLSRLLFVLHGLASIYLVYGIYGDKTHWVLTFPLILIIVETIHTIGIRKAQEYTYFWPSGFLYIVTIVPIIWLIELDLLNDRIRAYEDARDNMNRLNSTHADEQRRKSPLFLEALQLSNDVLGKKVCELGLIIGLISGRWLMPRGTITRDQLSALLLGYVGNAADILELFETFEASEVTYERGVTIAVISVYTWSLFQFTLVTTATIKDKKVLEKGMEQQLQPKKRNQIAPIAYMSASTNKTQASALKERYIEELKTHKILTVGSLKNNRGRGRKKTTSTSQEPKVINAEASNILAEKVRRRALHGEVFQILVTLVMQDGPFLILRLYLIIMFNISSEMHIFFTCKNAIVSILLVYRLCILTCRGEDTETNWYREEASAKLHNIQLAVASTRVGQNIAAIRVN